MALSGSSVRLSVLVPGLWTGTVAVFSRTQVRMPPASPVVWKPKAKLRPVSSGDSETMPVSGSSVMPHTFLRKSRPILENWTSRVLPEEPLFAVYITMSSP